MLLFLLILLNDVAGSGDIPAGPSLTDIVKRRHKRGGGAMIVLRRT